MKRRALISVSDKAGLVPFCQSLIKLNYEILSTGGTCSFLTQAGVPVTQVDKETGFPEILGGRVKTLHPKIHGGILASGAEHFKQLEEHQIKPIDMVVCNLYPFNKVIAKGDCSEEDAIANIDIGGVAMLRAAAKNNRVITITDPEDYSWVASKIEEDSLDSAARSSLAIKAFQLTSSYDSSISSWMSSRLTGLRLEAERHIHLRYGENPHQTASLYKWKGEEFPFEQLQGKPLSYNNLLDLDAAWAIPLDFPDDPCVAIIKHTTPCGLATGKTLTEAFHGALESDTVSAFGGIMAVNRQVDLDLMKAIGPLFLEVLVAPSFTEEALQHLAKKKKNCRAMKALPQAMERKKKDQLKSIVGGLLVQSADDQEESSKDWTVVSDKQVTAEEMKHLEFAWKAAKHVKSNAIVLAKETRTVGIGSGQPNRVDSVWLATRRAGEKAKGSVLGSDAFFPFPDGVAAAAEAGVTAIVQPGGSVRDEEVIKEANSRGIAMVFTGVRHFKH